MQVKFAIANSDVQLYPLLTDEQIQSAASHLYRDRSKLPFLWRKEAAKNILKEAVDRDLEIPKADYICMLNGLGVPKVTKLASKLSERGDWASVKLGDPEGGNAADDYTKIAEVVVEQYEEGGIESYLKLAEFIAAMDELIELNKFYNEIDTPEEIVFEPVDMSQFSTNPKEAKLADGSVVNVDDVTEATLQKVAELVGGEFAQACSNKPILGFDADDIHGLLSELDTRGCKVLNKFLN